MNLRPNSPPVTPTAFPAGRTAVLVIHGMGAQKPYTTLDQFARGIMGIGGLGPVQQEVLFRHWSDTSIGSQKDWSQTLLRITPATPDPTCPGALIDVYEYYWAPVITGLVTARQSLLFLLSSALTPFEYLRENLATIKEVAPFQPSAMEKMKDTTKNSTFILFRELARMVFIFLPLIAVFLLLLRWIGVPLLSLVASWRVPPAPGAATGVAALFHHWPLKAMEQFKLILAAIRYLFLFMSGNFLWGELTGPKEPTPTRFDRTRIYYLAIMLVLFLGLLFLPKYLPWTTIVQRATSAIALFKSDPWPCALALALLLGVAVWLLSLTSLFDPWIDAFRRGWKLLIGSASIAVFLLSLLLWLYCTRLWVLQWCEPLLGLPSVVILRSLLQYLVLAAALYYLNVFLTSAVGGLAVYLGADALSKNSAARSQILHESSQTLLKILEPNQDLGAGTATDQYDKVVIAAHSLGSVVALDMLNQLIVRKHANDPALVGVAGTVCGPGTPPAPLDKITGLLTFGSPLNKVVYFFSTRTTPLTTVLERILFVLHPFRLKVPPSAGANTPRTLAIPYPNPSPFGRNGNFQWINAWSRFDLISGPMFFYDATQNPIVERGVTPGTAHLSYWENPALYTQFANLL